MTRLVDSPEGRRIAMNVPWLGFFAHLNWCLQILAIAAERKIPVELACISPQYVSRERGADFIDYFFVDRHAAQQNIPPEVPWTMIRDIDEVLAKDQRIETGFEDAHRIFFGRYAFRPWILETLEASFRGRPPDRRLIGVHYRGTDKTSEAPRIAYEEMFAIIDREVARSPDAHIFLASDEAPFIDACRTRYGDRLLFLRDYVRAIDGKPLHRNRALDGFHLGRDAVLNCAALARCDILIKTPSTLSGWAKIVNPALETYLVTRPFSTSNWFPDGAIPSYPQIAGESHN